MVLAALGIGYAAHRLPPGNEIGLADAAISVIARMARPRAGHRPRPRRPVVLLMGVPVWDIARLSKMAVATRRRPAVLACVAQEAVDNTTLRRHLAGLGHETRRPLILVPQLWLSGGYREGA